MAKLPSISTLLVILFSAPGTAASQSADLSFRFSPDPPGNDIRVGDTVEAAIWMEAGTTSITAFTISLTYVPALAQIDSVLPGTVLTSHGYTYFFLTETAPGGSVDTLKIDAGVTGPAYGPGSLALIYFIGVAEGVCPLHFTHWDLCTEEGDSCVSIPTTVQDDTLFVTHPTSVGGLSLGELKGLFRRPAHDRD